MATGQLSLAGTRHFASAILDGTRGEGGWCDPPLRVSKVCVVELSEKDQWIALDEYLLADGGAFFDPRSKLDPVMRGR